MDAKTITSMHKLCGAIIVRADVKLFRDREGHTYEISQGPDGHPIVQSGATGKFFIVDWDELVELAIARGINQTEGGS